MISQRREFPAENHFTFSGRRGGSEEVEFSAWAERIKGSYGSFGRSNEPRVGAWTRRIPKSFSGYSSPQDEQFRCLAKQGDDEEDSDVPSPTLWDKARSPASRSGEASPIHDHCDNKEKPLYPVSRAQVIARYRQEMMDLVKDVPENAYELSLKDIVELPRTAKAGQQSPKGRESPKANKSEPKAKLETVHEQRRVKKGAKKISRSESMDTGGLFLKMFLPASLGRRKNLEGGSVTRSKVSPKPMSGEVEKGGADGEWWKTREFSESSGSSRTGSSSTGSGSSRTGSSSTRSGSSSTRRKMTGCYPFLSLLQFYKSKARALPGSL